MYPSYFNFFQRLVQGLVFAVLRLVWVAAGCILIPQAVRFFEEPKRSGLFCSQATPSSPYKSNIEPLIESKHAVVTLRFDGRIGFLAPVVEEHRQLRDDAARNYPADEVDAV